MQVAFDVAKQTEIVVEAEMIDLPIDLCVPAIDNIGSSSDACSISNPGKLRSGLLLRPQRCRDYEWQGDQEFAPFWLQ